MTRRISDKCTQPVYYCYVGLGAGVIKAWVQGRRYVYRNEWRAAPDWNSLLPAERFFHEREILRTVITLPEGIPPLPYAFHKHCVKDSGLNGVLR